MTFETRLTPELKKKFTETGYWGEQTFFDLFSDRVAAHPDRECLVDARERLTYAQLNDRILRTAAFFKSQGVGARRCGDDPAPEPGRVCLCVFCRWNCSVQLPTRSIQTFVRAK